MASARQATKEKLDSLNDRLGYLTRLTEFNRKAIEILNEEIAEQERIYSLLGGQNDTTTVQSNGG